MSRTELGEGGNLAGHFDKDMPPPDISKPTPFIYLGTANRTHILSVQNILANCTA